MKGITQQLIVAMAATEWELERYRLDGIGNHRRSTPKQFGESQHCKRMTRKNRRRK